MKPFASSLAAAAKAPLQAGGADILAARNNPSADMALYDQQPFPSLHYGLIAATALLLPFLLSAPFTTRLLNRLPSVGPRLLWVLSFALNLACVMQPGRFDGQAAAAAQAAKDGSKAKANAKGGQADKATVPTYQGGIPWTPVFAPAGWAFAIWAVIYLGEALVSAFVLLFDLPAPASLSSAGIDAAAAAASAAASASSSGGVTGALSSLFFASPASSESSADALAKAASRVGTAKATAALWWAAGSAYQCLWCAAFRPAFSNHLYVPASLLGLAAIGILGAHSVLTSWMDAEPSLLGRLGLALFRAPLALHGSWLCAASLLNFNSWAARSKRPLSEQVSLATASAFLAAGLGAALTIQRRDPLLALTFAWVLLAVGRQTLSPFARETLQLPQVAAESLALTERGLALALAGLAALVLVAALPGAVLRSS